MLDHWDFICQMCCVFVFVFFCFNPKQPYKTQTDKISNFLDDISTKKSFCTFWVVFVHDSKPRAEGSFSSLREKKQSYQRCSVILTVLVLIVFSMRTVITFGHAFGCVKQGCCSFTHTLLNWKIAMCNEHLPTAAKINSKK